MVEQSLNIERYQQDLLIKSDILRIISLGFESMDNNVQKVFFDNLEDFLSNDFKNYEFYKNEIMLFQSLLDLKNHSLEYEYHRLFDSQNGLPFSEANYVGIEKGNIIGDVAAFYKASLFPFYIEDSGSPDSIKMETGFISYLYLKEFSFIVDEMNEDQESGINIIQQIRQKFLAEHYFRWVPQFIENLIQSTENQFYLHLGMILQKMLDKLY